MRVLHVIDSLAGTGGAENRMVEEVVALGDRFEQRLIRLFARDDLQPALESAGIEVTALGFDASKAARTWPLAARRLRSLMVEWRPDVVQTALAAGNLAGQLAARPLGVPVLSTFNRTGDLALQQQLLPAQRTWKARIMRTVARRAARQGDVHFRALNAHTQETNCRLLGISVDRATVIPRGIAVDRSALVTDRSELGLPDGGPLFVNVGRMTPEKAQHILVEAFAVARARHPGARLVIVGPPDAAEPDVKAAIARHGLVDDVLLLGYRRDARSITAAADVFVSSSLSEGMPGAVLEALVLGTPVAGFDIPPLMEVSDGGRHAHLARTGSSDDLARAMVDTYLSPSRAEDAAAAQTWARRFDLATVAAELGDLLEARASARPGAEPRAMNR
jgi:glycosyltransferase involved in cell wall biosynthesis